MSDQNISKKKKIFKFIVPFIRFFFSLFFDKKYLTGKYFDESLEGWRWASRSIVWQKIFGFNRHIPWPVSPFISILDPNNIEFNTQDINNFQTFGNYFQNSLAKIIIGRGTWIASNTAILTHNHDLYDLNKYQPGKDVVIGNNCWIGTHCVILPGIHLGDHTIVGAGSVVTKSFPDGYVVIVGNPANVVKIIDPQLLKDNVL